MDFKKWFWENSEDASLVQDPSKLAIPFFTRTHFANFLDVAKQVATKYNLDQPTNQIGAGAHAQVFATTNPNLVIRVSLDDENSACEKQIAKPKLQNSGGVNKIYKQIKEFGHIVSYKEKLNTNWEPALQHLNETPIDTKYVRELGMKKVFPPFPKEIKFLDLFHIDKRYLINIAAQIGKPRTLLFLKSLNIPELEGIIKAIEAGLPLTDLKTNNLGLDSSNNLVVLDC